MATARVPMPTMKSCRAKVCRQSRRVSTAGNPASAAPTRRAVRPTAAKKARTAPSTGSCKTVIETSNLGVRPRRPVKVNGKGLNPILSGGHRDRKNATLAGKMGR